MNKAEVIERHARNLKSEVGTGLSTSECYQIIKSAVNEVLNLPCVTNRTCYTCKYCMYESTKPKHEQFSCFVSLDIKGITDPHSHICKKWSE